MFNKLNFVCQKVIEDIIAPIFESINACLQEMMFQNTGSKPGWKLDPWRR